jgi:lysozyme family protein
MTDLVALKAVNAKRWTNAKLTRGPEFARPAQKAFANKARYVSIAKRSGMPEIAWLFVAVSHYRESSQDFTKNLGQGDPLDHVSTRVPAGRGPFVGITAFEDGAVDALVKCAPYAARNTDWSIAGMLTLLERYNGLAYANAGRPSPYIWSGTDQYVNGKVLVDHGPIEPVVDKQLGCAGLILAIMALDSTVRFDGPAPSIPAPPVVPVPLPGAPVPLDAKWLQASLNALGATPALAVDGILGAGTRTAVRAFQASKGLVADGLAGPETVAALKAALTSQSRPGSPVKPSITKPAPGSIGAWVASIFAVIFKRK